MTTAFQTRTVVSMALAAGLTATAVLTGTPAAAEQPAAPSARQRTADCTAGDGSAPASITATANRELTQAFRDFGNAGGGWENQGGWAASDGIYSTEVPGRGVVYLNNDTFLGPVNEDESMDEPEFIHGTIVLGGRDGLPETTIAGGTQEDPESIADPPDAVDGDPWYWNGDGMVDRGRLVVFQFRTGITDGEPPWNFGWVGTDIVTYTKDFQVADVTRTYGTPGGVSWGNELVRCGRDVYVYGQREGEAYVARAGSGRLTQQDWEFFDGSGWSAEEDDAVPIAGDVGASYSVTPMNGRFVLTTTATDIFTNHEVYVATAASPTGPFTGRTAVYTAPEGGVGSLYAPYNVAAHPAISDPDQLVVSYNVNAQEGDDILADANNNRPRFITVAFDWTP